MGLAWQQAPLGPHPLGRFLLPEPTPEHLMYAEPVGRRMRVELAGVTVAHSDAATLLHETGRYPVAYFPTSDMDTTLIRPSETRSIHPLLGQTTWWSLEIGGDRFDDAAWSHLNPPAYAAELAGLTAFVWDAMDAFYEEDEQILGHAADPYHRVDIRASSRHLTAHLDSTLIADTRAPLAVFETGFAPRWYLPRIDVDVTYLHDDALQTMCPYKGVARYYDVVTPSSRRQAAAWTYPHALPESARLAGYISFDPEQLDLRLDGQSLTPITHQQVDPDGTDRNLRGP